MRQVKLKDHLSELGEARKRIIRSSISGEAPLLPVVIQDVEHGPDDDAPPIVRNPVPQAAPAGLSSYAQGKNRRNRVVAIQRQGVAKRHEGNLQGLGDDARAGFGLVRQQQIGISLAQ